ncbi:GAF and ANTAR domain-containing protein [Paenarthrobacter sp. NPDC089322]|uniref:GAF and ANTAR domain-containing protein n=1 Tax=Paenarthrobacter sp. NPDC089322 TaxID=3155065 RepID=UPI003421DFA1
MDTELPLADELAAVFARATNMLLSEETVSNALNLITEAAVLAVDDASGAGVSLMDPDGSRSSTASTNSLVAQADSLQYELGQGPCLTAWASGEPVNVEDVRADSRWPEWGVAASDLGLRSCVSVPLLSGDLAFGAIKIYWDRPRFASPRLIRLVEMLAAQASIFLLNIQSREKVAMLSDQLKIALSQRDIVGTAKGIVMARQGLSEGEAILYLITRSNNEGRPLGAIAQDVVDALPGLGS